MTLRLRWTVLWRLEDACGGTVCATLHTLRSSDTKCQLWYFPLPEIWNHNCSLLFMADTLPIDFWLSHFLYYTCPVVTFQSHWAPWVHQCRWWVKCTQVCNLAVRLGALPADDWLLSIYMDHGDIQRKNAFIFIDYFIELYVKWVSINVFTPKPVFVVWRVRVVVVLLTIPPSFAAVCTRHSF